MKISQLLSITVLGLCSFAASAATVWQPTDGETDFIQFGTVSTNGGTLALFDDSDFGGNALIIGSSGGQVTFTAGGGSDWTANAYDSSNSLVSGPITLTGGKNFTLGMSWDGGATWSPDASFSQLATYDTYLISFDGQSKGQSISGSTMGVDLQPVPVPAAAWLFGTGLLGLVGVARRRA